ncbi:MAG: DedA family protein [Bacteroidetes bacterium]|nr:DedA family protein [Bacteroidota bacterium]
MYIFALSNEFFVMGITEFLVRHIIDFYNQAGYFSIFILMTMESMIFPVPSEVVMPPAGLLIAQNRFTFPGVIMASTLGSIFGSMISYFIGSWGGRPFIDRFGKYFLLNRHDLDTSERFFNKYGDATIFFCRFIPVVRHLISIPAGFGKMNLLKFSIYTIAGAGLWNSFLTYVGFKWGETGWNLLMKYSHIIDIIVLGLLLIALAWFIFKHINKRKKNTH